jgi:hypothetical protein
VEIGEMAKLILQQFEQIQRKDEEIKNLKENKGKELETTNLD